jgi:hypothetical protein
LGDLDTEANALSTEHTFLCVALLEMGLQFETAFVQIDDPGLLLVVIGDIDIDAAFADIRVELDDFGTELRFIDHGTSSLPDIKAVLSTDLVKIVAGSFSGSLGS